MEAMMNKSVAYVLRGFTKLDTVQRQEFISEINKFLEGETSPAVLKKSIMDSVVGSTRMTLGPPPTGCPCCGK